MTKGPASFAALAALSSRISSFATVPLSVPPTISSFLQPYASATYPVPTALPLTGFTALHATRLAYLYHSQLAAQGVRVGKAKGEVGYIQAVVVCVGLVFFGTSAAAALQGVPSPIMAPGNGEVVMAYASAAVGMAAAYPAISKLPQEPLKVLFLLTDALACAFGTISLGLSPMLSAASSSAPLALPSIIIPLLCGAGGSLLVPLLSLFSPEIEFSHPNYFSTPFACVDIWGCFLITMLYGGLVSGRGPLFGPVRDVLQMAVTEAGNATRRGDPMIKPEEAQVLCALALAGLFLGAEYLPKLPAPSIPQSDPPEVKPDPEKSEQPVKRAVSLKKTEVEKLKEGLEQSSGPASVDESLAGDGSNSEEDSIIGGRTLRKRKGRGKKKSTTS